MWKRLSLIVAFSFLSVAHSSTEPANSKVEESSDYSGKQSDEWVKVESQLSALKTKLDAQKVLLEQQLELQKKVSQPNKEQVAQLNSAFKKYKELVKEYNEKVTAFELKYPEKGINEARKYQRLKTHEIDDSLNSTTLSGRIKNINKRIKSQYGQSDVTEISKVRGPKTSVANSSDVTKKKPSVTDKIILVK